MFNRVLFYILAVITAVTTYLLMSGSVNEMSAVVLLYSSIAASTVGACIGTKLVIDVTDRPGNIPVMTRILQMVELQVLVVPMGINAVILIAGASCF